MDHYSEQTRQQLRNFIQQWNQDRKTDEELIINASTITIRNPLTTLTIETSDFMKQSETLLERCLKDIQQNGIDIIPMPHYIEQSDEQRLTSLLQCVQQSTFRQRKSLHRLEVFYYLGEVLTLRGWQKVDTQRINTLFSTTKSASDFKKTAKRTYELFIARGLANLYAVKYIRPYHLLKLKEEEFYDKLIPEARNLHFAETSLASD